MYTESLAIPGSEAVAESSVPKGFDPVLRKLSTAWEFWPAWAMYGPLIPWFIYLAIRYRHPLTFAASNPGILFGGLCGESKSEALTHLQGESVLGWTLLDQDLTDKKLASLERWMNDHRVTYPIILKPDVGERGSGVRLVSTLVSAREYFNTHREPVIAQAYHPGPFEAGVFYYRFAPDAPGAIFSITDKVFPIVVGDGSSTLKQLIQAHPRLRRQADTFFTRHAARLHEVLGCGAEFTLARAGNHCQGTLFCDGHHLVSQKLASALDRAVESFPGFCFGRFDIRYADPTHLREGKNFSIVEVNGVSSESTDIYDPRKTFFDAQSTLRKQWELAFKIGAANRARGARLPSLQELFNHLSHHFSRPKPDSTSD